MSAQRAERRRAERVALKQRGVTKQPAQFQAYTGPGQCLPGTVAPQIRAIIAPIFEMLWRLGPPPSTVVENMVLFCTRNHAGVVQYKFADLLAIQDRLVSVGELEVPLWLNTAPPSSLRVVAVSLDDHHQLGYWADPRQCDDASAARWAKALRASAPG
jgi:hypothetical protein